MTDLRAVATLSVLAGATERDERLLLAEREITPFSVGTKADWSISAPGVEPVHFFLAFDGKQLFAAAASENTPVWVRGARLGTSFTPLGNPCEICFGAACIGVGSAANWSSVSTSPRSALNAPRRSALAPGVRDLCGADGLRTQVLELSGGAALHTQLLEVCARDLQPSHAIQGASLDQAPPDSTVCDGGALRELALRLAAEAGPRVEARVEAPRSEKQQRAWVTSLAAEYRALPLSRKLIVSLLPFVVTVFLCLRKSDGAENLARAASPPAPAHSAVPVAPAALPPARATPSASAPASAAPVVLHADAALEREALRATFSGNTAQAGAAYDRLARAGNREAFELASRLVRENRVRKP
jgi:hypothetical protein